MYHDRLSAFTDQANILRSSWGIAEDGTIAFGITGTYNNYSQCAYTGENYDYICQTSITPVETTHLMTNLTMPYRFALRPSKNKKVDMSMSMDLRLAVSFTNGTDTVTIPDAHIAGKMIIKGTSRNMHILLTAFDLPLDSTSMDASDKAEMQAAMLLIKSKMLNTWYFTKIEKSSYDDMMELMSMSRTAMPVDMDMVMKSWILSNLGRDNQLGRYRILINTDTVQSMTSALVPENDYIAEMPVAMMNETWLNFSGSFGRVADGHVTLALDDKAIPLDEDTNIRLSDCAVSAPSLACTVSASDSSWNALMIQLSAMTNGSGWSMSLTWSVSSKEWTGTAYLTSQRTQSSIRASDFALPRWSKSLEKAIDSLDAMF